MDAASLKEARILVIDDEPDVLMAAQLALQRHFGFVRTVTDPSRVPDLLGAGEFDAILLDMNFAPGADTGKEGLLWLQRIRDIDPLAAVVVITAYGDLQTALGAMKAGAADFVVKPWENARLIATVGAAVNLRRSRTEAAGLRRRNLGLAAAIAPSDGAELIGSSPVISRLLATIARVAPTDTNILILGENGTGKELAAREIHCRSARRNDAFVRVDVGTVPHQIFESEMFGHRKGAFTDAKYDRIGRMQAASGGTLFLDEIANVPLDLQAKLLTAIERREVVPVGANKPEAIDVRLVCATNASRQKLSDSSLFRQDLLYRINTIEILMPPLRERRQDILLLAEHFIAVYSNKYNFPKKALSARARDKLMHYDWPGNVRSLRHSIERALVLGDKPDLEPDDFPFPPATADAGESRDGAPSKLDGIERRAIAAALHRHNGNISRAAEELGLSRAALYRRMEKYGI
jgi:two-component system response regulator HydG